MAKQKGVIKLSGSVDDLTFTRGEYGSHVRMKSSLNKERVTTDPAFEASRGSSKEFGRAGKHSGSLKRAVLLHGVKTKDARTHPRLSKLMGEIVRMDKVGVRGERYARPENLHKLQGFEWHRDYQVSNTLYTPIKQALSSDGKVVVSLPRFAPELMLKWAKGATHVEVSAVQFEGDFREKNLKSYSAHSGFLAEKGEVGDVVLELAQPTEVTIVGLGLVFYQLINGSYSRLRGGECFCILERDAAVVPAATLSAPMVAPELPEVPVAPEGMPDFGERLVIDVAGQLGVATDTPDAAGVWGGGTKHVVAGAVDSWSEEVLKCCRAVCIRDFSPGRPGLKTRVDVPPGRIVVF